MVLSMIFETFPVGPLQCNCTILGDEQAREAIVIDPGDDVSRIHKRLTERGLTLKQILDKLGQITGLPSPKIKLPYLFAFAAGVVDEAVTGILLRREPRATVDTVRMGKKKMFASSAKAERELGWKIVPVDGALRRAADWFRANGYA